VSKIICSAAIRGAHKIVERAQVKYEEALEKWGPDQEVGFPNTAYYLPIIYGILGIPVKKVGDMKEILERCRSLLRVASLFGSSLGGWDGHVLCRRDHRGRPLS
jgi:acetyl-CoA synthase